MLAMTRLVLVLSCALFVSNTFAQQAAGPVEATARALLERETADLPGTVEIELGTLDPANRLPRCTAPEAFLPSGTRAWGRISVGVRCTSPVVWTVYLPARIGVLAQYVVTRETLTRGQTIGPDDITLEHGDLTTLPEDTLTDPARAIGVQAARPSAAGAPLRADMLRMPPAVERGQNVRVTGAGKGFNVSSEGRSLGRAGDGESVRVRLANGQIITGIARAGGVVEIRF